MRRFDLDNLEKPNGILTMDGYDDCIVGLVHRFGFNFPIACYDREKVIARLMEDGMTEEEAWEFFAFNQIGAWCGEGTPCFLERCDRDYIDEVAEELYNEQHNEVTV